MARVLKRSEANTLELVGRKSREIVSGAQGSRSVTLRLVEIPVARLGDAPRGTHFHDGFEECIFVLSGQGITHTEGAEHPLEAGDTILIPSGEKHVTRNTGKQPLVLLCFFPVADVSARSHETPT